MMDFIPREGIDYATDAEQSVIGSMLFDSKCIAEVVDALPPEDFYLKQNRDIYETICWMFGSRLRRIDVVTVLDQMRQNGTYDENTTRNYVLQISDVTPTAANVAEYIRIVKECAQLRAAHQAAEAMGLARTPAEIQSAMEAVSAALTQQKTKNVQTLQEAVNGVAEWLQSPEPDTYIPTGIAKLDDYVHLQKKWMVAIGGFPSDGKSLLAIQMAYNMAKDYKVGYFFLEDNGLDVAKRVVSHMTAIDFGRINRKQVRREELGNLAMAMTDAGLRSLDLIEASGYTTTKIRAVTAAKGYDVVFIDYIQIVESDDWRWDDTRAISKICRDLCKMAVQLDVCLIALSQFHRLGNGVKRAPMLSDFRHTGQLEQDVAVALLLSEAGMADYEGLDGYNDGMVPADAEARLLQIAKNRNGRRDVWMHLLMRGQFQRFDYWRPDAPPDPPEPRYSHEQEMIPLPDDYPTPFDGRC